MVLKQDPDATYSLVLETPMLWAQSKKKGMFVGWAAYFSKLGIKESLWLW